MPFARRGGTVARACLIAIAFAASCSLLPAKATARSLKTSAGEHWTVLASSRDLDTAIGIARYYGSSAMVVLSRNGWYAAVLKPLPGTLSEIQKTTTWSPLPQDAFLSNGRGFEAIVWQPRSSDAVRKELTAGSPATLSLGGFTVTVRRIPKGDGWTAKLAGTVDGISAFSFDYDFPQASDSPSTVALVDLDRNNAQPEVVFEAFTGGAHCCTRMAAVAKDAAGQWKIVDLGEYDGGGSWFEDVGKDSTAEILHGDNTFLYKFASYAESFQPLTINVLENDRLKNVSSDPAYRRRIVQQLRGLEFQAKMDPGLWHFNSFLAAWVADKFLIGEGTDAWARMLPLYTRDTDFNVVICTIALPLSSCPPADQKELPFPEGLRLVLEEGGYMPSAPQGERAPATAPSAASPENPEPSAD